MQELQRIKTKDEDGNVIEEKKVSSVRYLYTYILKNIYCFDISCVCMYVGGSRSRYSGSLSEKNPKNHLNGENRFSFDKVVHNYLIYIIFLLYVVVVVRSAGSSSSSSRVGSSFSSSTIVVV